MAKALRTLLHCLLLFVASITFGTSAEAGDLTAFITRADPSARWQKGYGAALGSTWFRVVTLEAEVARIPGADSDYGMTSLSGAALLTPPLPILTPYAGVGVGVYRQSAAGDNDLGTLRSVIIGAKMSLGLLVIRADYRKLHLSGPPVLAMDSRLTAGAGISF
jgi:hypothetical protein